MLRKTKSSKIVYFYCLFLAVLSLGVFTKTILAAAGNLDISFGGDGIVSTPIPNVSRGSATDIIIQPDGKSVVSVFAIGQSGFDLAVVRYNPNGTLDTSFSGDGIVNTPFGSNNTDTANALALQSDGKILVAGTLITSQSAGFVVLRFNSDGSLDTSFDGDGIVVNSVFISADGLDIAVQADGKILVAGHAFNVNGDFFSVTRLNTNGSLDSTFGNNGTAAISFGFIDFFSDMVLQPDGKIILMGNADVSSSNPYPALVRFNSNGVLDNTFDGDGRVTTQIEGLNGSALALQTDGKILVSGSLSGDFAVLRYNSNGSLDTSFSGDGVVITSFGPNSDAANDLIVQPDNKIIAVGETAVGQTLNDLDIAVARYNTDGSLDTTFGNNGKTVTRIGNGSDLANAVALQADGKILLAGAGTELGSSQVTLVRYLNQSRAVFDFDGDGKTDVSVFRPTDGGWYLNRSQAGFTATSFGLASDLIVPADFDGDGKTDIAVFRPSDGTWYGLRSSDNAFFVVGFGQNGDLPRPADFDGDGKADFTVFRPSNGTWYRLNSSNNQFVAVQFGLNGDAPLVADFDGDGKSDIAVWRSSGGFWYWLNSSNGQFSAIQFGSSMDTPVAGDFDGDGKTDINVFRSQTGTWYRLNSSNGVFAAVGFGRLGDVPIVGDYDGDGKSDVAVWRPSDRVWYWLKSSNGEFNAQPFGSSGDKPVPAAFLPYCQFSLCIGP